MFLPFFLLKPSCTMLIDLINYLSENDAALKAAFEEMPRLRFAVNQEMAKESTVLKDGDEVAFFPPVTGG